ncbi:MAG: kelch repeat-containing protein, partial [bacterium]
MLTYSIAVTNAGPGAAFEVRLEAALPQRAVFLSAEPTQGICVHSEMVVTCRLASLAPGAEATVEVVVVPAVAGTFPASVTASSTNDPTPVTASASPTAAPAPGTWAPTGSLAVARFHHTATLLPNGKVLVAGGVDDNHNYPAPAELYDPLTGTWSPTGSLNIPRSGHTATRLGDGKVLVAGGANNVDSNLLSSAELYDPVLGTWSPTRPLNVPRSGHTAALLADGKVVVLGGVNLEFEVQPCPLPPGSTLTVMLNSVEIFDPEAEGGLGAWVQAPPLNHGRGGLDTRHTATALPDGRILVLGGYRGLRFDRDDPADPCDQGGSFAPPEVLDPSSGDWTPTGETRIIRQEHTATLLPDGRVLVAGGDRSNCHCPTLAPELFKPEGID